jgi:hypothetical protein
MIHLLRSKNGWTSLIGMLIAMAIIAFLFVTYLRPGEQPKDLKAIDQATSSTAKEAGIDTSSHLSVLESSKKRIAAIEEMNKNRGDELMKEIGDMQQY